MSASVSLGQLRDRVAFDAPHEEDDGSHGTIEGWREQCQAWARIRPLRGGETVQAARLEGRQPVVVYVLAGTATRKITPSWRMRKVHAEVVDPDNPDTFLEGAYNITSAVETEDRRWIEITAETGVAI